MSYLVVLCEGHTEMGFVQQVLAPHLDKFGTVCHPILLGKKIKHNIPEAPGGVFNYEPVRRHIYAELKRHTSVKSFVTTMLDFYAFPRDFPDFDTLAAEPDSVKRVAAFENAMAEHVGSKPRFIANIQLHEFETLVFSHLEKLRPVFEDDKAALKSIDEIMADIQGLQPEEINHTKENAPSKRLLRHLPRYNKRTMGPRIVKQIGLPNLRTSCPHFGEWLTKLEQLGSADG